MSSNRLLDRPTRPRLRTRELLPGENPDASWNEWDVLLIPSQSQGRYTVGFAASQICLEAAQRLRFEVFNLEMHKGLSTSYVHGLDQDIFDEQMTHIILLDREEGSLAGTYRMQTAAQGLAAKGLYSSEEFDLAGLSPLLIDSAECGRACIAAEHRNVAALLKLWAGIGAFMQLNGARYLFGCCSLQSADPDDGWRTMKTLRERGVLHPAILLRAKAGFTCGDGAREFENSLGLPLRLPKLFQTYVKLGAKVISEPALDRDFGTVDFLILMDSHEVALSSLMMGK